MGSEMCIRDRASVFTPLRHVITKEAKAVSSALLGSGKTGLVRGDNFLCNQYEETGLGLPNHVCFLAIQVGEEKEE